MTTLDEGENRREGSSHSNEGLSSSSHMNKGRRVGKNGGNDGVSVFLFSTHHIPHALKPYLSTTSVSTRLVEQCLWNYRDTIFLAREYGHKTDAERTQLRVHLLQLQREKTNGTKDTTDGSESAPFFVESQLWDLMLREPGKHPILLSESLRYQQILQDMKHLARGLLAPIEILRHRNYWLLLQEDVQLNLSDRLLHYRVVLRQSPPVTMVTRLWCDLWALLGATWRQRERLMGVYAEGIPPADLNGDASQLPPFPSTPPSLRDAYCERQRGHAGRHAKNGSCSGSRVTDDTQTAFEEEGDNLAFGPLLPHRVGITTLRHYAIRVPLLSFLRSLRVWKEKVAVTASRRGPNGTGRSGALPRDGFPAAKNDSVNNDTTSIYCIEDAESLNAPFFDNTAEDLEACQVPYISPEWFVRLRLRDKDVSHEWDVAAVLHSYSDDAWNIAVLTLEFMLTGFPLAESCCGHPDCLAPPTSSCFDDVMKLLVKFHGVPLEAAQNFLYAALHELSLLLRKECELPRMASEDGNHLQPEPLPQRLAEEWYLYLCRTYGPGDGMNSSGGGCSSSGNSSILREVAECGLLWSRRERWKAFQAAHALFLSDAIDNSSAAGENGAGGCGTAVLDAAQRVLSSLSCPLIPLHPTLCAAATRGGVVTESLKLHMQPIMSLLKPLSPSLWDLQMQLRVWRQSVERHAMVDGGCRKDGEARRNVVFREFVHVVRRILQQQPCEPNFTGDTMEEASRTIHSRLIPSSAKTFPANGSKLSHSAAQNGLLRGLMERSALFSYCTDGFFLPEHNNPAHGIGDGQDDNDSKDDDDDDDDDNRFLPVFPFSQVFLPMEDLLALLHKDVVALKDSSPSVTVAVNALDTLVGAKLPTNLRLPLALSSAAADVGLLKSFKRVVRAVDLNVAQQLTLIAGLRPLLHVAPTAKRAMLVRRYLTDVQTVEGISYVPVPATIRGEVWGALLQVPPEATRVAIYYALNTSSISVFDRQLSVDIPRCHQYHPLLVTAEGHERMRRVIKAWLLMNPELTYWQGIDSVCAVLLTVSFTNEALVAAQMQKLTQHYIPHGPVESSISGAKSMEDHLHQLVMMLRYCDPRLAVHLLDEVECHPEIFAISWFLTLFAHSLPVGKVCLLWDFLFLYNEAYPHCLTALCLAVLLQQRDKLLGNDFSVCLLALSRLHGIDVHLVLRDAALILRSVPSSVALLSHYFNDSAGEVRHCGVSYVSVQTILQAFNGSLWRAAEERRAGWMQSGLFLVDLRTHRGADVLPQRATRVEERVVGALLFPLAALHAHEDDDDDTGATKYAQRLVTQQATELLLQLDNMAMAALPPLSKTSSSSSPAATELKTKTLPPPIPVGEDLKDGPSTALQECAMAPHVVLFTRSMEPVETAAAESLALELVRCGTPHVSILFGGFVELKREASHLVVEFEED
ncbi:hypothetical protein ECC02_006654 [Trypanosoma cruzi]|uniref:Rab-GAP TBC domain-containing protein n=2 Tax=Trypanosoma cruzi TaxID=5693 RepID=A0A7J6Y266_TRYCR|nr:hypothetical protein ECC02_006654 [Trypanosoma cruzi]